MFLVEMSLTREFTQHNGGRIQCIYLITENFFHILNAMRGIF